MLMIMLRWESMLVGEIGDVVSNDHTRGMYINRKEVVYHVLAVRLCLHVRVGLIEHKIRGGRMGVFTSDVKCRRC